MNSTWVIHKFGGTSLADAPRFRQVANLLRNENGARKAIVVSAMSKTTDALIAVIELAQARSEQYLPELAALKARHLATAESLVQGERRESVRKAIEADFEDLREILRAVYLSRACSRQTVELVSGYGELWSAQLLTAYLNTQGVLCAFLDARKVLTVDSNEGAVTVDWEESSRKTQLWLRELTSDWVVITGFIASTPAGIPTTLRRNGSDFSASIFGRLLSASEIVIWTDVDGVLSADPHLVPDAVILEELSYEEATELAYFGAKVVHPNTMAPAIDANIPIWIRNTFNPAHRGTKVHGRAISNFAVKGFATIGGMALINLEGTGMMGVPGVASRLFSALRDIGISVVMISQASSEHSICVAVPEEQTELARRVLERAFFAELHHNQIQTIDVTRGCSILAAVGDNMVNHPGVAGKFFSAIGKARINVRAIAQGSSERNISAVIPSTESQRALRAVHSAFYLSSQTISIGVIGTGLIGGAFLDQLSRRVVALQREYKIDLRVRGITNSKRMVLNEGRSLTNWRHLMAATETPTELGKLVDHVHAEHLPHAAIIDCTSSAELPEQYAGWLERGIHIITPNKKGNTGTLAFYRKIKATAHAHNRHYLYETTVGAGLPIINTLRELVQTGDEVQSIEGVFSGTLSYLFNSFHNARPFSAIVQDARAKGYMEPDPRDDLSGMDVARKVVILAREIGWELELDDVRVESLVPPALRGVSMEEFLGRLTEYDAPMSQRFQEAALRGQLLRYVGIIEPGNSYSVELRSYPPVHPFTRTSGNDNIVAFTTKRYCNQPLIVQGPGAGPEVTAGGVFADLLRLASFLGAS